MKQEAFGEKIGLSKSGISSIESGSRNVTDKHIKLLVALFNINEHWLRTGDGEMFNEIDLIDKINMPFEPTEALKVFIRQIMLLPSDKKKIIDELITKTYNELKERGLLDGQH